jgi:multimeric flavodoxin WrbA
MSRKILIISTSPRKNSNSEALAAEFGRGAASSGNDVEQISLAEKQISFCRGCLACQATERCVIHDDADQIVQKMLHADVLVFATPIYYYEMSGQMKTMLDRSNPLFPSDYQFRDVYFLASAAEDSDEVWSRAVNGLEGWIACFEHAKLSGAVFAGGVNAAGEIQGHPALKKAFEMGAAITA